MQCATHPGVETELRCREHGLIPTPPIYRVTPAGYGAAVPAGLVLGAVAGRLIGEAMSFSSGWKRGPRLAAVAAATIIVGAVVGGSLLARLWYRIPPVSLTDLLQGILAVPPLWVFGAFAAMTAYWRIR